MTAETTPTGKDSPETRDLGKTGPISEEDFAKLCGKTWQGFLIHSRDMSEDGIREMQAAYAAALDRNRGLETALSLANEAAGNQSRQRELHHEAWLKALADLATAEGEIAEYAEAVREWAFQKRGRDADPVHWPDLGSDYADDALLRLAATPPTGASLKELREENKALREFAAEVIWGHLEFQDAHQCPWCLYVYRGRNPVHDCLVTEILPRIPSYAEWAAALAGTTQEGEAACICGTDSLLPGSEHRPYCPKAEPPRCHAGRDGDCNWTACPQLADYQSYCPLAEAHEAWAETQEGE